MVKTLTNSAGVLSLRGLFAILFGALALFWPNVTLHAIVIAFALFAVVNGIVMFAGSIKNRGNQDLWGLTLVFGLVSFIVGAYLISRPDTTAMVMAFLVGAYALAIGIFDVAVGITMRRDLPGGWVVVLIGVLSLIFAGYMFINPAAGIMAVLWILGIYFLIKGIFLLGLGISAIGTKPKKV